MVITLLLCVLYGS